VVLSASASYAVLIECAKAGNGFAGVENAGFSSGNGVDEFPRQCSNAAQALEQIEDNPFTGEDDTRVVADDRNRLPGVQTNTVENLGVTDHIEMRNHGAIKRRVYVENTRDRANARQNTFLFSENRSGRALGGINAGVAGRIPRCPIFE